MRYFLNHNYYNILYIITMSSFEDNIRKYVELDNQLKLINDKAKLIRENIFNFNLHRQPEEYKLLTKIKL